MNPMEMLKGIKNPQQFIMQNVMKNNSNPMISQLVKMANGGDSKQIEDFARNFCKERGKDFDKEFSSFMNNFKG